MEYESTSYHGLFHFLRYMEQLERYQVDYGEVSLYGEAADTVRVMTIHKSKALNFRWFSYPAWGKNLMKQT